LLQNEKGVSNKDHLIAAKEKTTRNTRRELSDKRRGDEDNEANLQLVSAKNNGDKRKLKRIIVERHSYILTTTNSSRTTRSS
jgi:hypothetical protein